MTEERRSEWLLEGTPPTEILLEMVQTLSGSELLTPAVPPTLVDHLLMTELGWAWGTDRRIEPWSAYFEIFELLDRNPELLSPSGPDFWLFAHRGHGINSYGFGLIARVGQLLIAQQFAYGGAYQAIFEQEGKRPTGAECLNAGTHAWGATLEHLKNQPGPLRIAVFYSNYRAYAEIWTNDTALADAARGFGVQSDRGRWS